MSKILAVLWCYVKYIAVPSISWCGSLLAGFGWIRCVPGAVSGSLIGGVSGLLVVAVAAYQIGYQGAYREGGKRYFFVVFVAPIAIGIIGLSIGVLTVIFDRQ